MMTLPAVFVVAVWTSPALVFTVPATPGTRKEVAHHAKLPHPPRHSGGLRVHRRMRTSITMTKTLPILPMRSTVLFPGVSLPITAGRPQTLKAIEAALRDPEHRVFVIAQKEDSDDVTQENLYTVGTIATIGSVQRGIGGVRLLLEGHSRGTAMRVFSQDGY